jgi:putative transposase
MHHVSLKQRLYPTPKQEAELAEIFGCVRFVYNWGLKQRTDAYAKGEKTNYALNSREHTKLKNQTPWMNEISSVPQQQALRHLQTAFGNFFAKRSRYPTFKKKDGNQSATYTKNGFKQYGDTIHVSKIGVLKIKWSKDIPENISSLTLSKDKAGRYFVSVKYQEAKKKLRKTGNNVGIDLGITALATLSDSTTIPNPRYTSKYSSLLTRAQRQLSRKANGSKRREKARLRVAKIQAKIADCRLDNLHKATTHIVRTYDTICIEDLSPRNMMGNHCLAKAIGDCSFSEFRRQLEYKSLWYGKTVIAIDQWFPSSKRCHDCGFIIDSLPLDVREWPCPKCGISKNRDLNAAKNILSAGLADSARGGSIRPKRTSVRRGNSHRSENRPV